MVYSVIVMIKYLLFLRPIVMLLTFIISSITTTSYSQSIGRNYILARTFTDSIGKSSLDSIYYYDGLGRLEQTILRNAFLQGEDIVTLQEYDPLGRPSNRWNPVGIQGNEGLYVASESLTTRAVSFYKDTHPYSKPVYEASPLSRIREEYEPGKDWHTRRRSVKTDHSLYDNLSRLTEVSYLENGQPNNHFSTSYRYDMQGNMLNLKRKGLTDSNKEDMLDDLSFTYKGNQLADCMYDANGNQMDDKRKGISEMAYNHLNLPSRITFDNGNSITYLYDAAGTKRQTRHVTGTDTLVTDYCDNVIYENGIAKTLLVDGGYVSLSDRSYHYFIHDHQGNVRVVADKDGKVEERNDFYPFGGLMASSTTSVQPYKYNGKELDSKNGLNWYDYGARHYDPVIGRWKTMDPLAEVYYSWSPYAYCKDNPVNRIDPDGKDDYVVNNLGRLFKTEIPGSTYHRLIYYKNRNISVIVSDRKLLSGMHDKQKQNQNESSGYYNSSTNLKDAAAVFKFMADYTEVEWKLDVYKDNNGVKTAIIITDQKTNSVDNGMEAQQELSVKGRKIIDIHSHLPNGTQGGSYIDFKLAKPNRKNAVYMKNNRIDTDRNGMLYEYTRTERCVRSIPIHKEDDLLNYIKSY